MDWLSDHPLLLPIGLGVGAVNAACLLWLLFTRPATGPANGDFAAWFRGLVAEMLGTFAVVLLSMLLAVRGVLTEQPAADLLQLALGYGLTYAACLAALGRYAKGYFNPAFTLGLLSAGRLGLAGFLSAILGQLVGAIAAAALVYWLVGSEGLSVAVVPISLSPRVAFVLEAIATAVVAVMLFGSRKEPRSLRPLALGAISIVGVLALGPLTGGYLNPARSLPPALWLGQKETWLIHLAGPGVGAVVASVLMHLGMNDDRKLQVNPEAPTELYRQPNFDLLAEQLAPQESSSL